jgi:hypothetical protein
MRAKIYIEALKKTACSDMDRGHWTLNKYFFPVKQRKHDDVHGFSAIQFLSMALEF